MYIRIQTPRRFRDDSKTLEHLQKVWLRKARRHREALRAVQGKSPAILERPQKSRRRSRWRSPSGICWREAEEEIRAFPHCVGSGYTRFAHGAAQARLRPKGSLSLTHLRILRLDTARKDSPNPRRNTFRKARTSHPKPSQKFRTP